MHLVAYVHGRDHWFGVAREGDRLVPLCPLEEFYGDVDGWLGRASARRAEGETLAADVVRLVPPVPKTTRVFCVGLNYKDHASEAQADLPSAPTVFGRWSSSLAAHEDEIAVPAAEGLDWEGELAAIVGWPVGPGAGRSGRSGRSGRQAVLGYSVFNDLTARGYQMATSQWTLGKNVDGSGPLGPVVVTSDEVGDPCAPPGWRLETSVNGERVQRATTADMIFTVDALVDYIAGALPLAPGDVIATGTPNGVGHFRTPPIYLGPGDVVEVRIDGLGTLRNTIAAPAGPHERL